MDTQQQSHRKAPIEMEPDEFRSLGHHLVDQIADFLTTLPDRPVTPGKSPTQIREALGNRTLPDQGMDAASLLDETADLLFNNSTFNGHPRFWGYITSSASPIGALGDLLAAAINPNVGGGSLSPVATEIERQTVEWIAELIAYPADCGGLLVSGGNLANFTGFLAARRAKVGWDVRTTGLVTDACQRLRVYASGETHTWIQKAADLFGLGTDAICWLPTDADFRMNTAVLRDQIRQDQENGLLPFLVIGTAGSTSTGAIDPLPEIAAICREHDLWFHVDGAYGAPAAVLPDAPADLKGLSEADSVAIDPHKWLYAPLEAGCILVRDAQALRNTFSYTPDYYHFDENPEEAHPNYYEYGFQNSRGFRALKVWLGLRQVGRTGYIRMIAEDIRLTEELFRLAADHPQLEPFTQGLSVATFRYVPADLQPGNPKVEDYLNQLNTALLDQLQHEGQAYVSNAVIGDKFLLRMCVVNFRTSQTDIEALPEIVTRLGAKLDSTMRPADLR